MLMINIINHVDKLKLGCVVLELRSAQRNEFLFHVKLNSNAIMFTFFSVHNRRPNGTFRFIVRYSFVFASNNCDWVK